MKRDRLLATVVVGALLAAACAGGSSNGSDGLEPAASNSAGRGVLGGTNTGVHSVPLSDIHFDNFDGTATPLSEIDEAQLLALRDAIPPIDNPPYEPVEGGEWLDSRDLVLGFVAADGQAYAYPTKILNLHEIVNDELGGEPVLISYCPLCRSGIVYDRRLDGRTLSFGNTSALFESDLVMFDRETLSYWFQVRGEAIVGDLTGARLTPLPSTTTTWEEWRSLHPETLLLSRDLGFGRNYDSDIASGLEAALNNGRFPSPVSEHARDGRLNAASLVLGIEHNGGNRAYPIEELGSIAVNDTLGGDRIVVFVQEAGPAAAAFVAETSGRALTFAYRDGTFVDEETGSEWPLTGRAESGELAGAALEPLAIRTTFWFSYASAFPDAEVHEP